MVGAATGTAYLLVVAHRRRRGPKMHHKPQIGFIESHTEGTRGNKSLNPVGFEGFFGFAAFIGIGFSGVRKNLVPGGLQQPGGVFSGGYRQGIDNP